MGDLIAKVERLKLNYRATAAVMDVSFEVYSGEILAVIGPNGAGKTSAIECLEGLRRPTGGKVEMLGCDPYKDRRSVYRQVGIQLQEAAWPEQIKVRELCRLFASFYENPADWRTLLEQLGLGGKKDKMVKKLSGGEKQRLSVLLALLPRPKLLILDELTTGLDPEIRHEMWENLKQIRQTGTAVVLVSHYMDEVAQLADRLVWMVDGRSAFTGTQEEFRVYAKGQIPAAVWKEDFSLEEIYLLLTPQSNTLRLEGLS